MDVFANPGFETSGGFWVLVGARRPEAVAVFFESFPVQQSNYCSQSIVDASSLFETTQI